MMESWVSTTLGEICEIRPPKRKAKMDLKGTDLVSFVPMARLGIRDKSFDSSQSEVLDKVYAGYTYFAENDILLAKITPCFQNGKLGIARGLINGVGFGSSEFFVLRCNEEVLPEYLFYFLSQDGFVTDGVAQMSGAVGHQRVPLEYLRGHMFALPPLAEQEQIVAILDEAFEGIATATAHAERNLENARDVFQSVLQATFEQKGEGWVETTLDQMASDFGRGKSKHRPRNAKFLYGGKYPFVQTGDIRNSDHFITNYTQMYSEEGLKQSKLWPEGTVCITIAANIAETGILGFDACFPDSVIGMVPDPEKTFGGYVEYLLQFFQVELQKKGTGSAQDNINLGTFKHQYFPFAPLSEQRTVVQKLDTLAAETSNLETIYQCKLGALAELKQSLLQKAFSGELTADEKAVERKVVEAGV